MTLLSFDHDDADCVFLDFETQSDAELSDCGGMAYSADPSTRVLSLVMEWRGQWHVWVPSYLWPGSPPRINAADIWPERRGPMPAALHIHTAAELPEPMRQAAAEGVLVAHNACAFDAHVWEMCIGGPEPRWFDTIHAARACGLPAGLNDLGERLTGAGGKDAGRSIAKRYFKRSEAKPPKPGDYAAILRYNIDDVWLLREVYRVVSQYPAEADVVVANEAVNARGVGFDAALARRLVELSEEASARSGDEIAEITGGRLHGGNLRKADVGRWLADHGVKFPDMRRETVDRFLRDPEEFMDTEGAGSPHPDVPRVLRLRNAALRITGAKLNAALARQVGDRLYDLHVYHGAHTGRFTSHGVQTHNLPRPPKGLDVPALLGDLSYEAVAAAAHAAGLNADDAISAMVRPTLRAAEGHTLVVADFAQIECRCLAWAAGERKLLAAFAAGEDVYKQMAARIYGCDVAAVTGTQRQVGKVVVLGAGYQLSAGKMGLYAANQGIDLAAAGTTPEACIEAFRSAYPMIAGTLVGRYRAGGFWADLDAAAQAAVAGTPGRVGPYRFAMHGRHLHVTLPSGRDLVYRDARIEDRVPRYVYDLGLPVRTKPTLIYAGPRGEGFLYGGKLAENLTQAACRDLLCTAMVRCEAAGLPVVLHVHDELVVEVAEAAAVAAADAVARIMSDVPPWAAGMPMGVEGHTGRRYLKSPEAGEYKFRR